MKQIGHYTYNEANCLGQGAYGKVYEGINTVNNETVAIKKLDLILFEKDKYLRKQIVQEIEIMSKLNHKNIVKFVELLATKKSLFIVTEMCRSGDLKNLISSKNIDEQQAIDILSQILDGFKELVKNGVIHRDMKPANVLNDLGTVKIADFGFAKYVENYSSQLLKSCVGSPLYMAPQVLERHYYSTKCDIWSLGVIFYEMVHYDVPWKGRDEDDLLHNIKTQPLHMKPELSNFSKQFLTMTLVLQEESRASWDQLFELFNRMPLSKGTSSEDISEECIQKMPTWIQKPSIQYKQKGEESKQQLEQLQKQRQIIAYQHFVIVECYTHQIDNPQDTSFQSEQIKALLNHICEKIVQDSHSLIQISIDIFQKQQQKGLLWKMQEQLNSEHHYYCQMQIDIREQFKCGKNYDLDKVKDELKGINLNAAQLLQELISNWKN